MNRLQALQRNPGAERGANSAFGSTALRDYLTKRTAFIDAQYGATQ